METVVVPRNRFYPAYDVHMFDVLPPPRNAGTPFQASWALVAPGESSKPHRHDEFESFFIADGIGRVTCNDISCPVEKGAVVHFDPFERHTIENTGHGDLLFLSVVWRNPRAAAAHAANRPTQPNRGRRYVISMPPTPNGDLHLGHLSGPYLGGDAHARFLRMRGFDVVHVSGMDDFQSYVVAKSRAIGLSPAATADHYADEISATLASMDIRYHHVVRPLHSREYRAGVQHLFLKLVESGDVYASEQPALFDPVRDCYLFECDVAGRCPYCRSHTSGNICEECGHPNSCVDLFDPTSLVSGVVPEIRPIQRLHFRLSRYAGQLRRIHDRQSSPPRLRALLEQLIERGLPDVAVTHPSAWGVEVPVEGFQRQAVWAWFEMALGHVDTITRLGAANSADAVSEAFAAAKGAYFFGYDNSFYCTILYPAVFAALLPSEAIDLNFVCNEFYLLEDKKFSTSRGHAIWGRSFLDETQPDAARFYLAYSRPEERRTNFTKAQYAATVTEHLLQRWEPWLLDLGSRLQRDWDAKVPDTGSWTGQQTAFYRRLAELTASVAECYEPTSFSTQTATRLLCELVREAEQFGRAECHWRGAVAHHAEARTAIALECGAARLLALLSAPIMPAFAEWLWSALGGGVLSLEGSWPSVPPIPLPGTSVALSSPYFTAHRHHA